MDHSPQHHRDAKSSHTSPHKVQPISLLFSAFICVHLRFQRRCVPCGERPTDSQAFAADPQRNDSDPQAELDDPQAELDSPQAELDDSRAKSARFPVIPPDSQRLARTKV